MARFSIATVLAFVASAMATNTYLGVYDVRGNSVLVDTTPAAGFTGTIEIATYELGYSNPKAISSATGTGAGKPSFSAVTVTYPIDGNTPNFLTSLASGHSYPKVVLTTTKASGSSSNIPYLVYTFENVFLTSQQLSTVSGSPVANLSFEYADVNITYTAQKPDGSEGNIYKACWNVATNTDTCS